MSDLKDDPYVKDLLPGYIARRREELDKLEDALGSGDYATLRIIGHNLHGSGGAYGLPRLSELGRDLEQAARSEDGDAARTAIVAMRGFIETL